MAEIPEALQARLAEWPGVNAYLVAFSGGLDSSVLLHAMAAYVRVRRGVPVRAVHIHHGLQPDADAWALHCRQVCAEMGLPIEIFHARISPSRGESPEAAARHARYRLFRHAMQANDALLTAHHSDDQLETLLMRLVRGAGVEGLAGIPAWRPLGPGRLLRPFLGTRREALVRYAREHGLRFREDPSNSDNRFDRNYLRNDIVPRLKARWPAAAASAARSAKHLAAAGRLIQQDAVKDLRALRDEQGALPIARLRRISAERLRNLLRGWIAEAGFDMPSTAKLGSLVREVIEAAPDAEPCVDWAGAEVRRYRDRLILMRPLPPSDESWGARWNMRLPLALPTGLGSLVAVPGCEGGIDARLVRDKESVVCFRRGGERIRPAGQAHRRTLRNLYQEKGVVPWMRPRVPLLYVGGSLAAVADLWVADGFAAAAGTQGLGLSWEGHPPY